jgi:phosphatidylglycerol---prolipoprotein diacylglyceryl transferase
MYAPAIFPVIAFPALDPVLIQIGPFAIRWYALAYIAGLVIGWRYLIALTRDGSQPFRRHDVDDFLLWATLGVVLGGRIGYVLFYRPGFYLQEPLAALQVWQGGMSFHGGLLGVIAATWWFSRRRGLPWLWLGDRLAAVAPIGLGLGRIANFINGELWGRVSDVPWAMVFPGGGPLPRHPSQLYQAGLEGALLFAAVWAARRFAPQSNNEGFVGGVFLIGYAIARVIGELFREPDAHLGFLIGGTTYGQWLSLPLAAAGMALVWRARAKR